MRILPLISLLSLLLSSVVLAQELVPRSVSSRHWGDVEKFAYQLQDLDIEEAYESENDLLIVDYSQDGSHESRFSRQEIEKLQSKPDGSRRLVLAYFSIGEAETYRFYWPGKRKARRQGWLGTVNPDWSGHYRAKYWNSAWKAHLNQYLEFIYKAGFDGVYLDRVDVYKEFLPERGYQPREEMIKLLLEIATQSRQRMGSDFGVFIQNAEELVQEGAVLDVLTGLGREDFFHLASEEQAERTTPSAHLEAERHLRHLANVGKLVLCVDYPESEEEHHSVKSRAKALGFLQYSGHRALDSLRGWLDR